MSTHAHPPTARRRHRRRRLLALFASVAALTAAPIGAVSAQVDSFEGMLMIALGLSDADEPLSDADFAFVFDETTHPFFGVQEPSGGDLSGAAASLPQDMDVESVAGLEALGSVFHYDAPVDEFAIDGDAVLFAVRAPRQDVDASFFDIALLVEQPGLPVAGADPAIPFDPNAGFNLRASLSVIDGVPEPVYEQFVDGTWQPFQMPFDAVMLTTDDHVTVGLLATPRFVAGAASLEVHVSGFPTGSDNPDDIFIHRATSIATPPPTLQPFILDLIDEDIKAQIDAARGFPPAADSDGLRGTEAEAADARDVATDSDATDGDSADGDGTTATDEAPDTAEAAPAAVADEPAGEPSGSAESVQTLEEPGAATFDDSSAPADTGAATTSTSTDGDGFPLLATIVVAVILLGLIAAVLFGVVLPRRRRPASDRPAWMLSDFDWDEVADDDRRRRSIATWHGVLGGVIGSAQAAGHEADADGWLTFTPAEFDRHFIRIDPTFWRRWGLDVSTRMSVGSGLIPQLDAEGNWVTATRPEDCSSIQVHTETKEVRLHSPETSVPMSIPSEVPVL